MSDLGSHWNDLPFWALKLQAPITVEGSGPPPHPEIAPASMSARYEYAASDAHPALNLTWHQGESKPEIWKKGGIPQWDSGCLFIGNKGMLLSDYSKHTLLPEKDFAGFQPPAPTIPRSPGHHQEWLEACKTGQPTSADFQVLGLADGSQSPRECRVSRRQKTRLERKNAKGHQCFGSGQIHSQNLPERLAALATQV